MSIEEIKKLIDKLVLHEALPKELGNKVNKTIENQAKENTQLKERLRVVKENTDKRILHIEGLGDGYGINSKRVYELKWVIKQLPKV